VLFSKLWPCCWANMMTTHNYNASRSCNINQQPLFLHFCIVMWTTSVFTASKPQNMLSYCEVTNHQKPYLMIVKLFPSGKWMIFMGYTNSLYQACFLNKWFALLNFMEKKKTNCHISLSNSPHEQDKNVH